MIRCDAIEWNSEPTRLLRCLGDLVVEMAGLMIAAELTERRLVQLHQDFAQRFGRGITGSETLSINLAQRPDEGVAMLVADFTIVIAVTIVETGLAHAALRGARMVPHDSILLPRPNGNLA